MILLGSEYGYNQTVFGSFQEVLGTNARDMIFKYKQQLQESESDHDIPEGRCFSICEWWTQVQDKFGKQTIVDPTIVLLILIGSITAMIAIAIDIAADVVGYVRLWILEYYMTGFGEGFAFWVLYGLAFTGLALFFTHYISPNAAGSGIPEVKCILSGVTLEKFLTFEAMVAKTLGLLCSFLAGLIIGQDGPIVHISSCLTEFFGRTTAFQKIRTNPNLRHLLLSSAVAAGIACTHSATFGGVLFSIEVTSTYYTMSYYLYAFVATIPAGVVFRAIWNIYLQEATLMPFVPTQFSEDALTPQWYEWFLFVFIGISFSGLGILFIRLNFNIIHFRRRYVQKLKFLGPFPYTVMVGLLTSILLYPRLFGTFMVLPGTVALRDLYSARDLIGLHNNGDWSSMPLFVSLTVFFVVRLFLSIITSSAAIPGGIVIQLMVQGAALGRIIGEVAHLIFPRSVPPGVYAVLGAAAFSSSTTQAVSAAMIVFETTGDISSVYPVIFVVVISVGISKYWTPNLYDSMMEIRRLPYLPPLKSQGGTLQARDIMTKDVTCLPLRTSLRQIKKIVKHYLQTEMTGKETNIPIVDNLNRKLLISSTNLSVLKQFYQKLEKEIMKEEKVLSEKTIKTLLPGETNIKKLRSEIMRLKFDLRPRLKQLIIGNPLQILPNASLQTIHIFFSTMRLSNAFVAKNGKLKGVIQRADLVDAIKKKHV